MAQPWFSGMDRTCPQCRRGNALSAEIVDEELEKEQLRSDRAAFTYRYSRTLYVNVNCKYCGFTGSTTLSKCAEGGSRMATGGSVELWGAQDYPAINPDTAIQIIIEREKHPRHRWTAPW